MLRLIRVYNYTTFLRNLAIPNFWGDGSSSLTYAKSSIDAISLRIIITVYKLMPD